MTALYIIAGIALTIFGLWDTVYMAKKLASEGAGISGAKIKLLGSGIMCIILGIALILHYV